MMILKLPKNWHSEKHLLEVPFDSRDRRRQRGGIISHRGEPPGAVTLQRTRAFVAFENTKLASSPFQLLDKIRCTKKTKEHHNIPIRHNTHTHTHTHTHASTSEMFYPPIWKTSGPGEVNAGFDPKTQKSALIYNLTGKEVHSTQTWRYSNKEINESDVIFDWDYRGFHASYKAWIKIVLELKKRNGTVETIVLMEGARRGKISGEGQEAVSLKNCAEYSFIIQGRTTIEIRAYSALLILSGQKTKTRGGGLKVLVRFPPSTMPRPTIPI